MSERPRGRGKAAPPYVHDPLLFVTELDGSEVFGHVTRRAGAEAIRQGGFRVGEGRHGVGVYLLPPEEEWQGLRPSRTPAQEFKLRWHEGLDDLRVLRVTLPAGARLLRVDASAPNLTADVYRKLYGAVEGNERYDAAGGFRAAQAGLGALLASHGIVGLYLYDGYYDQDEILVFDPAVLTVVREQVQQGSKATARPSLATLLAAHPSPSRTSR